MKLKRKIISHDLAVAYHLKLSVFVKSSLLPLLLSVIRDILKAIFLSGILPQCLRDLALMLDARSKEDNNQSVDAYTSITHNFIIYISLDCVISEESGFQFRSILSEEDSSTFRLFCSENFEKVV